MRDSWTPDAQYLFLDVHPSEPSSLTLHAHGRHLTTGSVRVLDTTPAASDPLETQWVTTPEFDWLEKWDQASDAHHKRAIFYLKGEYFILHDLVLGAEAQTLEQTFRFNQGTASHIAIEAGQVQTQDPRLSNLFIGVPDTTDLSIALDEDSVIYRSNKESPAVLNTLLFPMKSGTKSHPTISALSVSTDADVLGTGFTLQSRDTTDTFLISDDGLAEMSAADITFIGEYLFLRRDASGAGRQFVMLNGRFLKVGPNVLADLEEPRESYTSFFS